MREEYYDQREALHAIKKTDDTRRSDELADLRAQVAQLTLERDQARSVAESMQQNYDHASHQHYESIRECIELKAELTGCRDLIARIAEAQRPRCTTECIEGVWWAKCKSGGVYGPHSTEREALLEVAEMAARTTEASDGK